MIDISAVILLLMLHTIMDFFCQTDSMAIKKSTSNKWLLVHVSVYSIPFVFYGLAFWAVTFVTHLITDYFSCRVSSYFWAKNDRHNFFCVIGVDQLVHVICLLLTYHYFY